MYPIRSFRGSLLLVPLLVIAACGAPEEDDALGGLEEAETPAETAEEMEMPEEAAPAEVSMMLETLNESGVTGTVTVTHEGESVVVDVQVQGVSEGEELPAHVHEGDCATGGSVLVPLNAIAISDGSGSSSTTLEAAQVPEDQAAYVQVHAPDGQPVACADLPGHGTGM